MKSIKFILNCVTSSIKKKIFKSQKTDISQECEMLLNFKEKESSDEDLVHTEEYLKNYNVTTRWQTV
jgi:hypothetical protein